MGERKQERGDANKEETRIHTLDALALASWGYFETPLRYNKHTQNYKERAMESVFPAKINMVYAEAIVAEDGSLHLQDAFQFALKPGQKVALSISAIETEKPLNLEGTVTGYDNPFGPAAIYPL